MNRPSRQARRLGKTINQQGVSVTVDGVSREAAPGATPQGAGHTGAAALALGAATTLGHLLSYAFSILLSRALGPGDFGALSALLGIAVVATVPATALQTQVARMVAIAPGGVAQRHGRRLGWLLGGGLALGLVVLAPALTAALRLGSAWSVVALGVALVPVGALAVHMGTLLGRGAFQLLALASVALPALRLVGGALAALLGTGVTGAIGLQAAAAWLGLGAVVGLVRLLPRTTSSPGKAAGPTVSGLVSAAAGLLGLFVLANMDVLLARVFLTDTESGLYAIAALGTKAIFWGTQFVALMVFPRVARGDGSRGLVLRAGGLVAAVGLAAALAAVPLAGPAVGLLAGPAYAAAVPFVPWFVLLGALLALVQLSTYAAVAAEQHRFAVLLWVTLLAEAAVVVLLAHGGIGQILAVCLVGTGLLALATGVALVRGTRR